MSATSPVPIITRTVRNRDLHFDTPEERTRRAECAWRRYCQYQPYTPATYPPICQRLRRSKKEICRANA